MTVTGLEIQLTHGVLADVATLGATLVPPKSLFKKAKPQTNPASAELPAQQPTSAKIRRAVQITKVTVSITSLVAGYQTAMTMMCSQCVSLSELSVEAHPSALTGSVQLHQLFILHQETHPAEDTQKVISQSSAQQHSHELEILHATHLSAQVVSKQTATSALEPTIASQDGNAAHVGPLSSLAEQNGRLADAPTLAATVTLTSWHTFFHADAVIALCKAASDYALVAQSLTQQSSYGQSENTAHVAAVRDDEAVKAAAEPAQASVSKQLSKLQNLPTVLLKVQLKRWVTKACIADHIRWGVTIPEAECKLDSRTMVAVQQQHLQAQLPGQHQNPPGLLATTSNTDHWPQYSPDAHEPGIIHLGGMDLRSAEPAVVTVFFLM